MTTSRTFAIFGILLVVFSIVYLVYFDQLQTLFNSRSGLKPEVAIPVAPSKTTISEIETDDNCQIHITLAKNGITTVDGGQPEAAILSTNFNPANSQCQEYMLKLVSPSRNFLAYEDLDNEGSDSLIKAWSAGDHQTREIGSVTPDSVIDMTFLPGDVLAILHGKNLSRGMQTVRLYDLTQPQKPFVTVKLTDSTKHYYYIASKDNVLQVFGPEGIKGTPIESWKLDELVIQFEENDVNK